MALAAELQHSRAEEEHSPEPRVQAMPAPVGPLQISMLPHSRAEKPHSLEHNRVMQAHRPRPRELPGTTSTSRGTGPEFKNLS